MTLGRRGVSGWLVERRRPGVVTIEPTRVAASLGHPRVGARNRLDDRGARLAVGLVTGERAFDVVAINRLETAGEHCGVLDRGCGALRHIGRHRMAGIAEQRHPAVAPMWQRLALQDRPLVAIRTNSENFAPSFLEVLLCGAPLMHVA